MVTLEAKRTVNVINTGKLCSSETGGDIKEAETELEMEYSQSDERNAAPSKISQNNRQRYFVFNNSMCINK